MYRTDITDTTDIINLINIHIIASANCRSRCSVSEAKINLLKRVKAVTVCAE